MLATPGPQGASAGASRPAPNVGAFLEVENLVKVFPGTRALDGVSITVGRSEIHALLGENGAGKSTLIRQICGTSQPTEGRILVEGREVSLPSPHAAAAVSTI